MMSVLLITFIVLAFLEQQVYSEYALTVLAGTGNAGWFGDNGPATSADVGLPTSCFVDLNSETFFVDTAFSVVRKVDTAGIIATIGGIGSNVLANAGGAFTSVALNSPYGIAGDSNYLYISDSYHIWKYNRASGIVDIMAGTGTKGVAGDGGPATSAQINTANGLWLTTDGVLYIAELGNNLVRKITTANIISTVVGGGGKGFAGDGGPAASTNVKLNSPQAVYMDTNGMLFFADSSNTRIRYVVNGIVDTYAGGGPSANTADGFVGTNAYLNAIYDLKGDSTGNIYIVAGTSEVRVVDYHTKIVTTYLKYVLFTGIWLGIGTTNVACVGMFSYIKTAPLYVPPTLAPTQTPTTNPSASPSKSPTQSPTVSQSPTASPTLAPTAVPTAHPTKIPTASPTFTPSAIPTKVPTATPTKIPTATPTFIPTNVPTAIPTKIPTALPTAIPTLAPTAVPTLQPSFIPTTIPTPSPSYFPTSVPSSIPSTLPTGIPSSFPSSLPTTIPSALPSSVPTSIPSAPTFMPTAAPTFFPTAVNPDVVKVDATARVQFVDGTTLNDVSLTTLITAFQNISDNPQSTTIVSTTLVSQSSSSIRSNSKNENTNMKSRSLLVIQGSFTYDIRFRNTYVMALHPGYNSSQLASLKVAKIQQQIELGSFETTLRNLAATNNALQLLNSTCNEVTEIRAVVVPPSSSSSSSSDGYSTGVVVGIVLGVVFGFLILSVVLYLGLKNRRLLEMKRENQVPHHTIPGPGKVTHYYQDVLKL